MVNKRFWLGILVIVLVFGMTVVGCDNDPDNGSSGSDSALNGTWVRVNADYNDDYEFTLNNGNFEGRSSNGISIEKGTYTTNNGTMTMKTTHWWGGTSLDGDTTLNAKWYTKSELQSALPSYPVSSLDNIFAEQTWTYSISGKTFTRTLADGSYTQTYTKK